MKPIDRVVLVSDKLRQRLSVEAGSPLSREDVDYFIDILSMRTALLYDLLGISTTSDTANAATDQWERTILSLTTLDVELYTTDWKTLREILVSTEFRLLPTDTPTDMAKSAFKELAKGRVHYKWILNATCALFVGEDWYRKVNQWVVFDARANFASLDLTVTCCREYLDFELTLPEDRQDFETFVGLSPSDRRTCRLAARDMFGDFTITDYPFRPKHGNGATREVTRQNADEWHKNRYFAVDGEIITYLRYRVPEEDWRDLFYLPYRGLDRTSSLVCVPKSMTKNRTISKEPTTLQFLQQDIFKCLDDYFTQHPKLGIDLHDQSRSRELALLGSADGSYATIDLSSASDSVSVAHVEEFFDGLPILYPLLATRSTHVSVKSNDGEIDTVIRTKKFAPMGSATCFPVESMIFSILCEAAVRLKSGRKSRMYDYVVYGDDIVIRTQYAQEVVRLLTAYGFRVNAEKSFGIGDRMDSDYRGSYFREACGVEALNGQDITPLRLSRRLVSVTNNHSDRLAGQGVGMVDLVNRLYLYGFWVCRRWVNIQLSRRKWYRTCLRLSDSDYHEFSASILLGAKSWVSVAVPFVITEDYSATQWRAFKSRSGLKDPLHRASVLASVARQRPCPQHHDSNDYYTWCLHTRGETIDYDTFVVDDTGIVTIRPRDLKWVKKWVVLQRPAQLQSPPR